MNEVEHFYIVFDGPPALESGRFIEVENKDRKSIKVGEWIDRGDGYWQLGRFVEKRVADEHRRTLALVGELTAALTSIKSQAVLYRDAGLKDGAVHWRVGLEVIAMQALTSARTATEGA